MIPATWQAKLDEYAAKFDASKDMRIHGGKGMALIHCQDCEDEGFVYFNKIIDGSPDWFVALCVCGLPAIPVSPRSCEGRRLPANRTWAELGLTPQETFPLRLQPFAASLGYLPFPCPEPLKCDVKYRRSIPFIIDPVERRSNQEKYDKKWGAA